MDHLIKAAAITAEMTRRRDTLRRLFGDRYAAKVAPARQIVASLAERDGLSFVQAGLRVCETAAADGREEVINIVIAATVDLTEGEGR